MSFTEFCEMHAEIVCYYEANLLKHALSQLAEAPVPYLPPHPRREPAGISSQEAHCSRFNHDAQEEDTVVRKDSIRNQYLDSAGPNATSDPRNIFSGFCTIFRSILFSTTQSVVWQQAEEWGTLYIGTDYLPQQVSVLSSPTRGASDHPASAVQ